MKRMFPLLFLALCLLLSACEKQEVEQYEAPPQPLLIEGQELVAGLEKLSLQGTASIAELKIALDACDSIKQVSFESCSFSDQEKKALAEEYPAISFDWPLSYGDIVFRSTQKKLDISKEELDIPALKELLPLCPKMEELELGEHSLSLEQAEELHDAAPTVLFRYHTTFYELELSTDVTEIDISGTPIEDVEELERELVRFPHLEKLIMCNCGVNNETMDWLSKRHENIRFVWIVQIYDKGIRTDQDYYIHYNCTIRYPRSAGNCQALRYCPDMVAVDVGHFFPTNKDLEFLYHTPHMKYLVIIEGFYTDITPLASLQELEYVEMFSSQVEDLSPLLECKNLKHLNISRCIKLDDSCIDVLCQMKQLERLWFCGHYLSAEHEKTLKEALPNTEIHYVPYQNGSAPYSMDFGWRQHESYYAMRDALHMWYMDNEM